MKKIKVIIIALTMVCGLNFALAEDLSPDVREAFKDVIRPWINDWFNEHRFEVNLIDDVIIKRRFRSADLYRFEVIDGRGQYSVNIVYNVIIVDKPSRVKIWGLKEQQIVFLLKGKYVVDYQPSDEYWKEDPKYIVEVNPTI